jgi:Ca2+-binding RTX toxin-like protein
VGFVIIQNSWIDLGDGNDSLRFDLLAAGPGGGRVRVSGNTFDGGAGIDTLMLGDGTPDEPTALVNVRDGSLRLGASPVVNVLTGFEIFVGTAGNDTFIDGAGDQIYAGAAGADLFRFSRGFAGDDVIRGLAVEDDIRFVGFGATLDSFAKIEAITTDTASGALITLGAGSTVLLEGFAKANLTADMFF